MEDRTPSNQEWRNRIDACRPDSGDLELPELRDLADRLESDEQLRTSWERTRRVDRAIATAMQAIATPDGLSDRLLQTLRAAEERPSVADQDTEAEKEPLEPLATPVSDAAGDRSSRRFWLAAACAALAASVVIAVFVAPRSGAPLSAGELFAEIGRIRRNPEAVETGEWRSFDTDSPAAERLRPSKAVLLGAAPEWRTVKNLLGRDGAVYRLKLNGGPRATLYVLKLRGRRDAPALPQLGPLPPLAPGESTGGLSMAAWRSPETLYVLVVEGGTREYGRFVPRSGGVASIDFPRSAQSGAWFAAVAVNPSNSG